jgi:hypothetical protein
MVVRIFGMGLLEAGYSLRGTREQVEGDARSGGAREAVEKAARQQGGLFKGE